MGRKVDSNRLAEIADYVERHPDCKPIEIARELNLQTSAITRSLPTLEDAGILLSEGDRGCRRSLGNVADEFWPKPCRFCEIRQRILVE